MSLLILIFSLSAVASEKELLAACPPPDSLAGDIWNCGENANVIPVAKACADAITASWKSESAALTAVMAGNKAGTKESQRQDLSNTMKDYTSAIAAIDRQIALMQKYTDLTADYAKMMIDFPDSTGDATSADCFNSAFHDLQKIVNSLDEQIILAKGARDEAARLWGVAGVSHGKIENADPKAALRQDLRKENVSGKVANKSSISGDVNVRSKSIPVKGGVTPRYGQAKKSARAAEARREVRRQQAPANDSAQDAPATSAVRGAIGAALEQQAVDAVNSPSLPLPAAPTSLQ